MTELVAVVRGGSGRSVTAFSVPASETLGYLRGSLSPMDGVQG